MLPRSDRQRKGTGTRVPCVAIPIWLLDAGISPRAIQAYCVLAVESDERNQCWPSRRDLARRMDCSVPTIDRALEELISVGAVTVRHRVDENRSYQSNRYTLWPAPPDS